MLGPNTAIVGQWEAQAAELAIPVTAWTYQSVAVFDPDAEVDEDGDIDVRLASQSPDCTVLVVVDGNGNGALDLDANGTPVEK